MISTMKVFFDTEFTNLETPHLISIGLVSEFGDEIYVVFDTFSVSDCSAFVRSNVLPILDIDNPIRLTPDKAVRRLVGWFKDLRKHRKESIDLISDASIDFELLPQILKDCIQPVTYRTLWDAVPSADIRTVMDRWINKFRQEIGIPHHALSDARVLKLAWEKIS